LVFQHMGNLKELILNLGRNRPGISVAPLFNNLVFLPYLKVLKIILYSCLLNKDNFLENFPDVLLQLKSLNSLHLDFNFCRIKPEATLSLAKSFSNLKTNYIDSLYVDLQINQLNTETATQIARSLNELKPLRVAKIDLSNNTDITNKNTVQSAYQGNRSGSFQNNACVSSEIKEDFITID